jgi:hypothetical protein
VDKVTVMLLVLTTLVMVQAVETGLHALVVQA